jgi:stage III sporulation protein AG
VKESFIKRQVNFFIKLPMKDKITLLIAVILFIALLTSLYGWNLLGVAKTGEKNAASDSVGVGNTEAYRIELEKRVSQTLSAIDGAGEVVVMISLDGEISKDIAYNESSSTSASSDPNSRVSEQKTTTKEVVIVKDGSGSTPYTISDKYPQVVGVVVVAEGGNDSNVRYYITEAIKTSLDVAAHKIVVLPKKKS